MEFSISHLIRPLVLFQMLMAYHAHTIVKLLLLLSAQSLNLKTKGAELTLKSQCSEANKNENEKLPIWQYCPCQSIFLHSQTGPLSELMQTPLKNEKYFVFNRI